MPIRGHRTGFLAGTAILLLLAAGSPVARGEEAPPDPDLSLEGTRQVGPFRLDPSLQIKEAGYDDNIYLDADRPVGDWTATAAPAIRALLLARDRGGLLLSQEVDYVTFLENPQLSHLNSFTRAKGILLLRQLELWLESSYASREGRPTTEILARVRQRSDAFTAGARSIGKGRLGWTGYARRERIRFAPGGPEAEAVRRNLDRDEGALSLEGELRVLPKTSLTLEGRIKGISFTGAESAAPGWGGSRRATGFGGAPSDQDRSGRDARIETILPGIAFDPSAYVQGEIRIGVARLEAPDWGGARAYRSTAGEGSLSARIGGAGRIKASCARSLEFSASDQFLYYDSTSWSAGYEQFFSRQISGEILYGRGLNDYPEEGAGAPGSSRRDRLVSWDASVRYRLPGGLAVRAAAQRMVREGDGGRLERGLYTIGAALEF